ncbi:hypothetical protein [Paenarthrobacter nitroguajacolicus]|uniref:hypothetical protein n=1 Tax=Paenarthrobacter nitroguajacolicus TaxID=211146 RepID=UPI00248BFF6C|nr:hypothetical protein [Paenarthrobacter nitroguajacolicus]MDI2036840.1 hypothetical protein [Paenarthrobacter nitroguajacolicus]
MTTSTTDTAARDFAIAEFFLGLAAVAQIAVAALGICAMTGLGVVPTVAITVIATLAGAAAFIIGMGRK